MIDYKLEDIFEIQIGKTPSRSNAQYWGETGNIWVSIKDLSNLRDEKYIEGSKEKITNSAVSDSNIKVVPANTLLYSFKLTIGKVAITKVPLYTNEAIVALIPKKNVLIDVDYVYYLLKVKDVSNFLHNAVKGKSLNKKKLSILKISLPEFEIQRSVSITLSNIQTLISKRTKTLKLLDEYANSIFLEMFGDPVTNSKKWKLSTISKLVKPGKNSIKRGPFGSTIKKEDFIDDGYLVYEQNHALNNDYTFERYYIGEEKYKELIDFSVEGGDILISCSGVNLGKLSIVPSKFKQGIINQALLKISLDTSIISHSFFVALFTNENFRKRNLGLRGAGIPNFPPMEIFKKFLFITPPIELQDKYSSKLQEIDLQKSKYKRSLVFLEELSNSLLQTAFNDKPEVIVDEIDRILDDELEIETVIQDIHNSQEFETLTQYDIQKNHLFKILERTESKKVENSDFSKGIIQPFQKNRIVLTTSKDYKLGLDNETNTL